MKRTLLAFSLLAMAMLASPAVYGQCVPDLTVPSGSFLPNPLPCGEVGVAYSEVVSFNFPPDTSYELGGGLPPLSVPFDSFSLATITNIPAGMAYDCNVASCLYVTSPPAATYGCVTISGTPTAVQAATDSVVVTGIAYITVFGSAIDMSIDIKISLEVVATGDTCSASVGRISDLEKNLNLEVYPNPVTASSRVSFNMTNSGNVSIELFNMMGQNAGQVFSGHLGAGKQTVDLNMSDLPSGIYFVKFNMDDSFSTMKKVMSLK